MLTWRDAVANIDPQALLKFPRSHGRLATVTAIRPPPRFGHLALQEDRVTQFKEKAHDAEGWINGAFFVLEPGVLDYIEGARYSGVTIGTLVDSLERFCNNHWLLALHS